MAPATSLFIFFSLFLFGSIETFDFKWEQCGDTKHVLIHGLNISPHPIRIPGKISLSLNYTVLETIHDSDVQLTMHKDTLFGFVYVPCVFHMGSCVYHHTCTMAEQMEQGNWGGMSSSLATQLKRVFDDHSIRDVCPHSPQNVDLQNISLIIPPNMFGQIWQGNYKVKIQTTDISLGREVFCLQVQFRIGF